MIRRFSLSSALLLAVLFMLAAGLTWYNLTLALPRAQWGQALFTPNIDRIDQMLFHYSLLPRLAISLLVGAGLGWWACCSSRCCVTRWRSRPLLAWRPVRSSASLSPRCGRSRA